MHAVSDQPLVFSWPSLLGMVIGFLLHWLTSWREWQKIGSNGKLPLLNFIKQDPLGGIIGLLTTVFLYFSLPVMGQVQWVQQALGYAPQLNFFSAGVTAWFSNSIAVKFTNIFSTPPAPPSS